MTEKRRKASALRLFFALWPDDQLREALRQATRKAVRASGGRPVPARNLHVTLAFLGSVAETDRASVEAAAAAVSEPAFAFALDRLKVWPRAKTLVLAPGSAGEGLARLHSTLWSGLGEIGYPRETRPFRPHVTLARKVATPGEMHLAAPIGWRADAFVLVRSVTDPGGAQYEVIGRWPLGVETRRGPDR